MVNQTASAPKVAKPAKKTLKERAIHELREFMVMFLYLLIPISLFVIHREIALKQIGIDYKFTGLELINALVLAKVMLIADSMGLGARWKDKALIWPIINKSIAFSILFIVVHDAEGGLRGLLHGRGFIESIPRIGGGGAIGLLVIGLNMALALIPFFAFRELSRVMGPGALRALLFKPRD